MSPFDLAILIIVSVSSLALLVALAMAWSCCLRDHEEEPLVHNQDSADYKRGA